MFGIFSPIGLETVFSGVDAAWPFCSCGGDAEFSVVMLTIVHYYLSLMVYEVYRVQVD